MKYWGKPGRSVESTVRSHPHVNTNITMQLNYFRHQRSGNTDSPSPYWQLRSSKGAAKWKQLQHVCSWAHIRIQRIPLTSCLFITWLCSNAVLLVSSLFIIACVTGNAVRPIVQGNQQWAWYLYNVRQIKNDKEGHLKLVTGGDDARRHKAWS